MRKYIGMIVAGVILLFAGLGFYFFVSPAQTSPTPVEVSSKATAVLGAESSEPAAIPRSNANSSVSMPVSATQDFVVGDHIGIPKQGVNVMCAPFCPNVVESAGSISVNGNENVGLLPFTTVTDSFKTAFLSKKEGPVESGNFYLYRLRQATTFDQVSSVIGGWKPLTLGQLFVILQKNIALKDNFLKHTYFNGSHIDSIDNIVLVQDEENVTWAVFLDWDMSAQSWNADAVSLDSDKLKSALKDSADYLPHETYLLAP